MSDEIEKHAAALRAEIESLSEYESFVNADEAVEEDTDAQEQIQYVRQLQNELYSLHQQGESHDEHAELHEELEEAQEELNNMTVMQEYHDAAEDLSERLEDINDEISEELKIDFAHFAAPE